MVSDGCVVSAHDLKNDIRKVLVTERLRIQKESLEWNSFVFSLRVQGVNHLLIVLLTGSQDLFEVHICSSVEMLGCLTILVEAVKVDKWFEKMVLGLIELRSVS